MAINVYLTVFKHYQAAQLSALDWRYMVMCYGTTLLVAVVYCFISTPERGKIYGDATLWCWISPEWAFLRVATTYGPAWLVLHRL